MVSPRINGDASSPVKMNRVRQDYVRRTKTLTVGGNLHGPLLTPEVLDHLLDDVVAFQCCARCCGLKRTRKRGVNGESLPKKGNLELRLQLCLLSRVDVFLNVAVVILACSRCGRCSLLRLYSTLRWCWTLGLCVFGLNGFLWCRRG